MNINMEVQKSAVQAIRNKKGFIIDMDGVIYHGNMVLPGAREFVEWLTREKKNFLFLTNASDKTPKELQEKLARLGIKVEKTVFYTSALATAMFLQSQKPRGSAFIVGEAGLINALYNVGYTMNNVDPDYVVIGGTSSYTYDAIEKAVNLVIRGAKLIGTNPDITGPIEGGIAPATKALISPIEMASGKTAYFIGKPNPLMMRNALKKINVKREDSVIIGDRMDTDIIAGIESEIDTVLVLSGISTQKTISDFPYFPKYVLNGVVDIAPVQ